MTERAPFGIRSAAPHALQLWILQCVREALHPHRALGAHRFRRCGRCSTSGEIGREPASPTGGALHPWSGHDHRRGRASAADTARVAGITRENATCFVHLTPLVALAEEA